MTATLDPKKKARLIKSIGLNIFVSVLALACILFYILPSYQEISAKQVTLNDAVKNLDNLTKNGVDVAKYESLVAKYAQIRKADKPDPEQQKLVAEALKKPADETEDYLDWVKKELSKKTAISLEIDRNNRIIAGSIPTFSDISKDAGEEFIKSQITLSDLNAYIEQSLLKKHNIESFSPIGFWNVSFDNKSNTSLNIGTYKLLVDVRGSNKNLLSLIDTIQKSGEISIKDGKLVDTVAAETTWTGGKSLTPKFGNLLTTIDSVSFTNSLEDPDRDNTANLSLSLYVRARNLSDLVTLRVKLVEQLKSLVTSVATVSESCSDLTKVECKNEAVIKSVQGIRSLRNDSADLLKKAEDKVKSTVTWDIASEFRILVDLFASTASLQSQVTAAANIIENARKQVTK